jgi:hypothetical protein
MALLLRQDAVGLIHIAYKCLGKELLHDPFRLRPQGKKSLILTACLYT